MMRGVAMMKALARCRSGSVSMILAGSLFVLIGTSAFAVDMGLVYLSKRKLQGIADTAALAAAGQTLDQRSAVAGVIQSTGDASIRLRLLEQGAYHRDPDLPVEERFSPGQSPSDAARITLEQDVPLFFGRALTRRASVTVSAKAISIRSNLVAFSIGSRLAAVNGGMLNAMLSALADTQVSLSVMDYNALLQADVDVLAFLDALRSEIHLEAASFGEVLEADITLPQILNALAEVLPEQAVRDSLRALAARSPGTQVPLEKLIDLGSFARPIMLDGGQGISVDAYSLLRAVLEIGAAGRQLSLDLNAGIPNLASSRLWLAIGERPADSPWLTITDRNSVIVRTAQARVYLDSQVVQTGLLTVRVPVFIELASASAHLASLSCGTSGAQATVTLSALPSVGQAAIADLDTGRLDRFTQAMTLNPAKLVDTIAVRATGSAVIAVGGAVAQNIAFSRSEIDGKVIKTVSTNDLSRALLGSLIDQLDIRITALGLGLSLSNLRLGILQSLTAAAPAIDGALNAITSSLGLYLGQADVRVSYMRCGQPMLVG